MIKILKGKIKFLKKREGYILIEMIIFLTVSMIIIMTSYIIIMFAIHEFNTVNYYSELEEISLCVQDKIRMEISESIDIVGYDKYFNSIKDGQYTQIKRLYYICRDRENRENIVQKNISISDEKLYIGKKSKYQIGNYVDKIFISEEKNKNDELIAVSFRIEYKKNKVKYMSKFKVYKKNK